MAATARIGSWHGVAAVVLTADDTEVVVVPELGMLVAAFVVIETRVAPPAGSSRLDRRSLLRKGAVGSAAFGAGVVVTALIPTAAAAASVPDNQEQIEKQSEQDSKIAVEQGTKEGQAKGEQQGKIAGEQASKEGADKGEQLTKEQLAKMAP